MLKSYIKKIWQKYSQGDAREESYYSTLEDLLNAYAKLSKRNDIQITTLPKKTEAGNPDFRIWDGTQQITGYIEAKAPTVTDLDRISCSEQLKRYLGTFPNVILTNFFEFRLYRYGQLIDRVAIGRQDTMLRIKTMPQVEHEQAFKNLLDKFFSFSLPKAYTAETLAKELAKRTRFLKEQIIAEELEEEAKIGQGPIMGFYEAFKTYLISELSMEEFTDLYSQTIVYGLFAARMRAGKDFDRRLAYDNIPETIGILRELFKFISLGEIPKQMEWCIDDIANVLSVADVKGIFSQYYHSGKGKDPVIYFYETFLSVYSPRERERRGVYYTPEPVVKYIVSSLNEILKNKMDIEGGLSDRRVTVLDPAAGTLSFVAESVKLAIDEFVEKCGEGNKQKFIREHILNDFYAFELMMAPYAIGHIKFSFILEEEGYKLTKDERPKFYLTNTLEMKTLEKTNLPLMSALSEESHLAESVKKDTPILVIMGNPPYSGISANNKEWISKTIKEYYQIEGKSLKEKNPKWLQDDYVKFIRFAQWKIEQSGEGVIGFITNHSYLDNPTFRAMRYSLLKSFDEIYLLNLHGNSLKKEKCPDGSKDENVFDIRQGVAISFFIKRKDYREDKKVFYADLFGLRKEKYKYLSDNTIKTTKWTELTPHKEFFFFVARDEKGLKFYETFQKVTDIFPLNSVGIVTARDKLTIKLEPEEVWHTVLSFSKMESEIARSAYNLGKDTRDWKVKLAQKDLIDSGLDRKKIVPILYRPFDVRYTYYTGKSRGFLCMPRPEVMQHMIQENLGLCIGRAGQVVGLEKPWNIVFCSKYIEDLNLFYRGGNVNFPLYLYPSSDKNHLFEESDEQNEKVPNLNPELINQLNETYKINVAPEEIFYYIYAVLYSNIYREKYAEFLKIDFPRIPFTSDYNCFKRMGELGRKLTNLHLLSSSELDNPISKFRGQGSGMVEKTKYNEEDMRVYINDDNYFDNMKKAVWEYQIGGYQVCNKWLKDRKSRSLSLTETGQYCKIVTAIARTIELQQTIDNLYQKVEKDIIKK